MIGPLYIHRAISPVLHSRVHKSEVETHLSIRSTTAHETRRLLRGMAGTMPDCSALSDMIFHPVTHASFRIVKHKAVSECRGGKLSKNS